MDRLRAIETFLRAIDLGSFNRTASAQGTTPQAVSKAVRQLERELGVQLFRRSTRKSSLTEEGRRFADKVRPGIELVHSAWRQAQSTVADESGTIRLTASPTLGRAFLLPLIGAFRKAHPNVLVELLLDDRYTDLIGSDVDVGFRSGFPPDAQLVVRELFRIQLLICASPAYLAEHGVPTQRAQLDQHQLTGARQPNTGRISPWEFQEHGELRFADLPAGFTSNDPEAETQAVLEGLGIGQLDSISTAGHLRSGALVPLMLDQLNERYGVYLYYAQRTEMPSRVRTFIDFVLAQTGRATACRLGVEELKILHRQGLRAAQPGKPSRRPKRA
jgi:DNA-binding transcriptional LysR family regulator